MRQQFNQHAITDVYVLQLRNESATWVHSVASSQSELLFKLSAEATSNALSYQHL
jgi:hypothetical protein